MLKFLFAPSSAYLQTYVHQYMPHEVARAHRVPLVLSVSVILFVLLWPGACAAPTLCTGGGWCLALL
jgi:hypothetical protein